MSIDKYPQMGASLARAKTSCVFRYEK